MSSDPKIHLRNVTIVVLLAVAVWRLPGSSTATSALYDILGLSLGGALVFLGYRLYMEHQDSLFKLGDRTRGLLYASIGMIVLALLAVGRLMDEGGLGVLVLLALIGAGVLGCLRVYSELRQHQPWR